MKIEIGRKNVTQVVRFADAGVYLRGDDEWDDFLLPNRYVPENLNVGDSIEVFVYFDSEERLIGTTREPRAQRGDFASLPVSAVEEFGIFLDWGLEKDLFLPFREQLFKMVVGESYPVHIYVDKSGRLAASTRLNTFVDKDPPPYAAGQPVSLLIYQKTDLGFKAIINNQYAGVIYRDDLIHNLKIGQTVDGFIKHVRKDNKIDLSLRELTPVPKTDLADIIMKALEDAGGFLPVSAKSSAEEINTMFSVSRKKFKMALGLLYKNRQIEIVEAGIQKPGQAQSPDDASS